MRHITLEQHLSVLTKVYEANKLLTADYPASKRIVSFKADRSGISIYIHGDGHEVEKYMNIDVVEWGTTIEGDISAVHAELDRIINECNERRMDRFVLGASGIEA